MNRGTEISDRRLSDGFPGGKNGSGVYQAIINGLPAHATYIEPFLGGGAIMRLKKPAAVNIGLDLDPVAIAHTIKSMGVSSRIARGPFPVCIDLQASTARAGGVRSGSTARTGGRAPDPPAGSGGAAWLGRFEFDCVDGIQFLGDRAWSGGELVYCDPPYVHSTRSDWRPYRFEMTDAQHSELLAVLISLPCPVVISGYWSELYDKTLKGWRATSFQTVTRWGFRKTEFTWSNFPEPVALHDYRYLGDDYRQRERIKKKKNRWVERLNKMPILERRALMGAISEAWGDQ